MAKSRLKTLVSEGRRTPDSYKQQRIMPREDAQVKNLLKGTTEKRGKAAKEIKALKTILGGRVSKKVRESTKKRHRVPKNVKWTTSTGARRYSP